MSKSIIAKAEANVKPYFAVLPQNLKNFSGQARKPEPVLEKHASPRANSAGEHQKGQVGSQPKMALALALSTTMPETAG